MVIENGLIFRDGGHFENGNLYIEQGCFAENSGGEVLDARGLYVIPGLIDIHLHGCNGYDFSDAGAEALEEIGKYQLKNGITAICPATMTLPVEQLEQVLQCAAAYEGTEGAGLLGVNLEGPFLSEQKAGAQNRKYLQKPLVSIFQRLQNAAAGRIKFVTVSPELEGAGDFIEQISQQTRVSLGHTAADYDIAMAAFEKGARHVTHLYNGMEPFSHRTPGLIGAVSDREDVMAELIADGQHVHPAAVRASFRLLGKERIIFISDSMRACGLSDGEYTLGGQKVTVRGKRAQLSDGTLAGSVCNLMDMVRSAVRMGIPLETAVLCAAANPAKALGVYPDRGSLNIGCIADAVLLDKDLNIRCIIKEGSVVRCE